MHETFIPQFFHKLKLLVRVRVEKLISRYKLFVKFVVVVFTLVGLQNEEKQAQVPIGYRQGNDRMLEFTG